MCTEQTEHARRRRGQSGFTLVELMVVIAILAILASVVGVNVLGAFGQGTQAAAKTEIKVLQSAVVQFKLEHRKLPSSLDELVSNSRRNYLDSKELPKDPWGNAYIYQVEGSNFRIGSYGADGSQGGDGENADIWSDQIQN
jgi:general secretion pathway protein G